MPLIKKLTKIGNSWGVLLPVEVMKMAGIETGSDVELKVKEEGLLVKPVPPERQESTKLQDPLNQRVAEAMVRFTRKYHEDLKKLA